jgi:Raf kinase inhibitor-like YbhB/YbcL family protein
MSALSIASPAFIDKIPDTYTCHGQNISPPLVFGNLPAGTQSIALVMHDPDAPGGDFTHWLLWNLSPELSTIEESTLPAQAVQGQNDFGQVGYGGPCPPPGQTHRYVFDLYALDAQLNLAAGARLPDLAAALQGHALAQAQLVATFGV